MLPQGLLSDEQRRNFNRRGMGAAIADGLLAFGGITPYASQAVAGQRQELEQGLLAQQQAEEEERMALMEAERQQATLQRFFGGQQTPQMPQPTQIPDSPMFARPAQLGEAADAQGLIAPQAQQPADGLLAQQTQQPTGGLLNPDQFYTASDYFATTGDQDQAKFFREQGDALRDRQLDQGSLQAVQTYVQNGTLTPQQAAQIAALPPQDRHKALYNTTNVGDRVVNPLTGEVVFQAPSSFENKVAAIMADNPGVTHSQASNIATGAVVLRQDPVTGRNFMVNIATGEQTPILSTAGEPPIPQGVAALSADEIDLGKSLGLSGAWRAPVNAIADFFTGETPSPTERNTTVALRQLDSQMTLLLRGQWGQKLSEQSLEILRQAFTVRPDRFFSGEAAARRTLEQSRNLLERELTNETVKLNNPYDYSARDVAEARNTVQQVANLIADMDVLLKSTSPSDSTTPSQELQDNADEGQSLINALDAL